MIDSISSISNLSINVPKLKSTSFNGGEPIQDKPLGRYGFEWDLKVPPTNLCSITLPEKVMAQLQSELGPQCDKSVAINLEHSHFGQAGTYGLRFLQSPDNPKQVYSLVKLVDAIVQQANSECSSQLFKQVNPMAYSNLESVLTMLANGDAQLKAEWSGLFVNKPRPVTTVERSPLDPRSQLASLVKSGNDEELANMLGKTGIQDFDIHGEDPVDYAKNQGLDHIIPVLQHYGVKPLEAKLKMHNVEFYQLIERAQQLKLSPGQILKLFNHFSEPAIARALSAKAKRAKDEDCDKILQLSPKQQREYDKLTASSVGPALALKSVARIR